MDFKLEVIQHYLTEHSYQSTANSFGIKRSIVQNWVRLYQTHGIDGIRIRKSKASTVGCAQRTINLGCGCLCTSTIFPDAPLEVILPQTRSNLS